jgi:hypothetical protein
MQEENDDNYGEEQDCGDEFDRDFGEDVRYYISEPPSIHHVTFFRCVSLPFDSSTTYKISLIFFLTSTFSTGI